ncbi:ThiF family adenylyltransferase [Spiroplasma turonicum]|uniref:THIF-type NAD/FAD binding fold domain-containing protein n=1 Tax=Spiroplasma turonicum TaxID=216946 RepID=A0A0K1P6Z1_9MOLU|nr:ThiF family adenylyltransferase [Spiroplasma turonicum]AKU80076.1 hypothetical protein STURON_00830 [Spiroplasma turonicum]ALX71078.1 hypothetical protein STURO_v1c08270 [Spiroplasma turonicum]
MKYIINNNIQIYRGKGKIIIDDFEFFKETKLKFDKKMIEVLLFFKSEKSMLDFINSFKIKSVNEAEKIIYRLLELNILKIYNNKKCIKNKTILIIGCGAMGSLLYLSISKSNYIKKIILIDDDIIEKKNLQMQIFTIKNIGKFKVDILEELCSNDSKIIKIKTKINSVNELCKIFKNHAPDISILCADEPDWKTNANIIKQVSEIFSKPYILSKGYIGNITALPEFYYPNDKSEWNIDSGKEELLIKIENKIEFHELLPSIFIITKQLENFFDNKKPIYYKEKGFIDKKTIIIKKYEKNL